MILRKRITREYSYTVFYAPIRGGGYEVSVPVLPGLITYGRTFDEARTMARDAIHCHLGALKKDRERIPSEDAVLQERVRVVA